MSVQLSWPREKAESMGHKYSMGSVCVCACACAHACVCVCSEVCVCVCVCARVHACMHVYLCACLHACANMHACVLVCVFIFNIILIAYYVKLLYPSSDASAVLNLSEWRHFT